MQTTTEVLQPTLPDGSVRTCDALGRSWQLGTVLPISEKFAEYGETVRARLAAGGVRVELDDRSEKLGYRIREAQLQKVPYMLVVGAREAEDGTVSVRRRAGEDLGAMSVDEFLARSRQLSAARSRDL